ncbi:hypothetical protein PRIC1_000120 [Phytophthora ramorum]
MATEALGKWQVQTDDYGNLYFYNGLTGESVWELPDEEDQVEVDTRNQVQDLDKTENPREHLSVFTIAVGVAEVVVKLVESIEENAEKANKSKVRRKFVSPAAEKRFLKNAANTEKKKKHLHDRNVRAYMDVLIPTCEPGSSTVAQEEGQQRRGVGSLFTAEESRKWQQERELEREAKRRAIRRARRQHQAKVESLQRHQQMLILFRSDLMKYLLGKILCSTELQRQRILLLTTPQMLAEMMERKREMQKAVEPEIAEKMVAEERHTKQKYEKNLQRVFEAIDEAGTGKLHLLQILFGVFSKEKPQKYAAKVRGLAELLGSTELQRFLIEFVSQSSRGNAGGPQLITVAEFREFVTIIEEVLDHYAGVKAAVEDAENDIEATLSTAASSTAGVSLARARMGVLSAKKIKHERDERKEHETQLQAVRNRERRRGFGSEGDSFVASKEEWEKNHHHRLIRLEESLPVFCCLCRRRKWELWRREQEEIESEYRSLWPTKHASRVKDEELRFVQERDRQLGLPVEPVKSHEEGKQETDSSIGDSHSTKYELTASRGRDGDDFIAVRETIISLVMLVEATMTEASSGSRKPRRKVHKKPAARSPGKRPKNPPTTEVQERVKVFEIEEQERKTMYTEELHMRIMVERNRRSIERPLLRAQDAAHDALVRLIEHCVNPSGSLARLDFQRCLSFTPPQKMVLAVTDKAVRLHTARNHLVLQTIPCRTEKMADYSFEQATIMQKSLRSPFVAEVATVDKHTFQLFSELGLLVECWPVLFVVSEYFDRGCWLDHYCKSFIEESKAGVRYAAVEQHLRSVFRQVASGLASMHSLGLLHLNVNLGNIYVATNSDDGNIHVRLGGLLSWKHDFDVDNLKASNMHDCFNYNYAPPEVVKELPITPKSDSWMLGCALCEALFMWQRQQLILSSPNQSARPTPMLIFHCKTIGELLQKLPIATSAGLRSLIRMLLQPNPAQRPQMNQVVDLLSSPSQNTIC